MYALFIVPYVSTIFWVTNETRYFGIVLVFSQTYGPSQLPTAPTPVDPDPLWLLTLTFAFNLHPPDDSLRRLSVESRLSTGSEHYKAQRRFHLGPSLAQTLLLLLLLVSSHRIYLLLSSKLLLWALLQPDTAQREQTRLLPLLVHRSLSEEERKWREEKLTITHFAIRHLSKQIQTSKPGHRHEHTYREQACNSEYHL